MAKRSGRWGAGTPVPDPYAHAELCVKLYTATHPMPQSYNMLRLKTPTWEDLKAYQAGIGARTLDEAIRELLRSQVQPRREDQSRG